MAGILPGSALRLGHAPNSRGTLYTTADRTPTAGDALSCIVNTGLCRARTCGLFLVLTFPFDIDLDTPIDFGALRNNRDLAFATCCFVLDIARRVGRRAAEMRVDYRAVEDVPDRGAPTVRGTETQDHIFRMRRA